MVLSPLLMDSVICIFRRLYYGDNIFKAHKLHLYQRLQQAGWSHSKVTILYGSTFLLAMIYLLGTYKLLIFSTLIVLAFGIYLDRKKAIKFKEKQTL